MSRMRSMDGGMIAREESKDWNDAYAANNDNSNRRSTSVDVRCSSLRFHLGFSRHTTSAPMMPRPAAAEEGEQQRQQQLLLRSTISASSSRFSFGSTGSSGDFVVSAPMDLMMSGSSCSSSGSSVISSIPVLNAVARSTTRGARAGAIITAAPAAAAEGGGSWWEEEEVRIDCLGMMKGSAAAGASSLVAAGGYVYAGSSSSNTITVWSVDNVRGSSCVYKLGRAAAAGAVRALVVVGDKLISAHHDHRIRVWRRSLQRMAPAPKHQSRPRRNHHHHDRQQLVEDGEKGSSSSSSAAAEFYEFFKLVATMPTVENYLRAFFLAPEFIRLRRHEKKRLWIEHGDAISALAVSRDGRLLYSASWDRSVKVWRLSDYMCVESVQRAHEDAVSAMLVSSSGGGGEGMLLYTGGADAKIKVWAAREEKNGRKGGGGKMALGLVTTLEGHRAAVNAMTLVEVEVEEEEEGEGQQKQRRRLIELMYSGGSCGKILVWEREESAAHMALAGALRGHRRPVLCLVGVGASMVVSGSADQTIRVWVRRRSYGGPAAAAAEGGAGLAHACVALLGGHSGPVRCLAISWAAPPPPAGRTAEAEEEEAGRTAYLYSGSCGKEIKIWCIRPSPSAAASSALLHSSRPV